jgi:hypothetical protein
VWVSTIWLPVRRYSTNASASPLTISNRLIVGLSLTININTCSLIEAVVHGFDLVVPSFCDRPSRINKVLGLGVVNIAVHPGARRIDA